MIKFTQNIDYFEVKLLSEVAPFENQVIGRIEKINEMYQFNIAKHSNCIVLSAIDLFDIFAKVRKLNLE